jgi:chemotaxis protein CheX
MNVAYVNPFVVSTIETFKTMLNIEVKPKSPVLKKEPFPMYDISGIIGLSGDAQGSISMSFPKILALKVVSALIGMDIKVVGAEVTDGIGEIANIVAGNAKQHLTQFNLSISLPNVVIGKNHKLMTMSGVPTIVVPFGSALGEFAMEITLKSK